MYERYFYLAEVLLVLAIAVDKPMILPAAAIQVASSITYLGYLGGSDLVPLEVTALLGVVAAVGAGVVLVIRLRASNEPEAVRSERFSDSDLVDPRVSGGPGSSEPTASVTG